MGTLNLPPQPKMGSGFPTLLRKELMRFWKVGFQTIAAPVLTALMYLLIFAHVLEGRVTVYDSVPYTAFLI
ncbi:MAG: ABC transporter permease, partial [Alcaligenes pakistanensis]